MTRVYVPKDSGARSVGADAVAAAFEAAGAEVVRTGSRGLYWLEPMAEIETADGRMAFGPLAGADAASVLAGNSARGLGSVRDLPALRAQTPMRYAAFAVAGVHTNVALLVQSPTGR